MNQNSHQNNMDQLASRISRMKGRAASRLLAMAVLVGALLQSMPSWGQDISWTNAGSGFWTNASSWSLGVAPSNNPNVNIVNDGSKTVTIDAATPAANLTLTNLTVYSASATTTNTLVFSNNSTPLNILGTLDVANGGALVVDGGRLVTTNAAAWNYVGYGQGSGNVGGAMTVSNGTWLGNQIGVGWSSQGTLTLAGGTNVLSYLLLSQTAGKTGTVLMTGGQLVTTNNNAWDVLVGSVGVGAMTVSGGTWLANAVTVGDTGPGTLTFAGGTNVFTGTLTIGNNPSTATGTVWLTGGQLVTTNASTVVGWGGVGHMTVTGGVWLAKDVSLGYTVGNTLTIDGGQVFATSVQAGNAKTNNNVLVTGGVLEANTLTINGLGNVISNSGGVYQFSTIAPTITPATGSIDLNGGTISFRGVTGADVKGNWSGSQLTNVLFSGNNTFRLNAASNTTSGQDYTFGTGLGATNYVGLEMLNGGTAWRGGSLTVGGGGTMLVSNTTASVGGLFSNQGTVRVVNSVVTWQSNAVISGSYVSDPSTNIFATNVTVTASGALSGGSNDLFVFYQDLANASTNRAQFNLVQSAVLFTNGNGVAATNHTLDLTGSGAFDMGSNVLKIADMSTNFGIGALSIAASNRLTLTGDHLTNALYVGWLDLSAWNTNAGTSLTNTLQAALNLTDINLYYDKFVGGNAYLQGDTFNLWGGGLLIPIPEPSALALTLAAGALSVFILRRKDRRE